MDTLDIKLFQSNWSQAPEPRLTKSSKFTKLNVNIYVWAVLLPYCFYFNVTFHSPVDLSGRNQLVSWKEKKNKDQNITSRICLLMACLAYGLKTKES